MTEVLRLFSDPAHWIFEVGSDLVIGGLFGAVVWPRIKQHFHRDIGNAINAPFAEYPDGQIERLSPLCNDEEIA